MTGNAKNFLQHAGKMAADSRRRQAIAVALNNYQIARDQRETTYHDWQAVRHAAAETKWEAIHQLDQHLLTFADKIGLRGAKVYWAGTDLEACQIIIRIIQTRGAHSIIKSKTMAGEEIHLNRALELAGFEVAETDLGEVIVQRRHEPPFHTVFPSMHLARGEIKELFQREFGEVPSDSPEDLVQVARDALREKYFTADVGITGANFAIAETGMISIAENEGNARLVTALPKTMITLVGIEKILPRFQDLALFLPLLATAGAGQAMTAYNTIYSGPRQFGENDGPEEFHVVLLDNRRTEILANVEQREVLHCIRCGACLNVCPIFRNVGGHAYGPVSAAGPIGAVTMPLRDRLADWRHLSEASSLCGACTETCPVKIDLHHHLLRNRRQAVQKKISWLEQFKYDLFTSFVNHPAVWSFGKTFGRLAQPFQRMIRGTALDPLRAWTRTRDLPPLAKESFKDWWRKRKPVRPGKSMK